MKPFFLWLIFFVGFSGPSTVFAGGTFPAALSSMEIEPTGRSQSVLSKKGMVVSNDRDASEWGAEILRRGGNAVDAAIATSFYMAVTRPNHSALGGGGFAVVCQSAAKPCESLDYRESAPRTAGRDFFLSEGKLMEGASQFGGKAVGTPGLVAGWVELKRRYGNSNVTFAQILERPIQVAKSGSRLATYVALTVQENWDQLSEKGKRIWGCTSDGNQVKQRGYPLDQLMPCGPQTWIRQPELALALGELSRTLDKKGASAFYEGRIARSLAASVRKAGGTMDLADLKAYRVRFREPVSKTVFGHEVISMGPPSGGGIALLEMLKMMELEWGTHSTSEERAKDLFQTPQFLHSQIHAMSLAFVERAHHLGDPDFWKVPQETLLSDSWIQERWKTFRPKGVNLPEGSALPRSEPMQTTHLSVVDSKGMAISATQTLNGNFGSGVVTDSGIVLNNEMDDFSVQPGVPNQFGLVGAEANAVAPGKRPLSSMSPTVVRTKEGAVRFALGAAGGPTITTSVFQVLCNRMLIGMSLSDSVYAGRLHHQWKPHTVSLERFGFSESTRKALIDLGYEAQWVGDLAVLQAIERLSDGSLSGVTDIRGEGGVGLE